MRNQKEIDNSYLDIAEVIAKRSYARRRKVGCVIVKGEQIISDGYNGTPKGFDNCCETLFGKDINDDYCNQIELTNTKPEVLHAEANAITKLAKSTNSSIGATLYVTDEPCFDCAKLIIQAEIARVVYRRDYRLHDGIELLKKANIEVVKL